MHVCPPAVASAKSAAEASAAAFNENFKKGKGRAPSVTECVAAAQSEASAASLGGGGTAFAGSKSEASAASLLESFKGGFIAACEASAKSESFSFTSGDGAFSSKWPQAVASQRGLWHSSPGNAWQYYAWQMCLQTSKHCCDAASVAHQRMQLAEHDSVTCIAATNAALAWQKLPVGALVTPIKLKEVPILFLAWHGWCLVGL